MDEDAERIINLPYFKWRSDSMIQATLNVLVGAIFFGLVGWDNVTTNLYHFQDRWQHLTLVVVGAACSGAFIFQNRRAVRLARWAAAIIALGDIAGLMLKLSGRASAVSTFGILGLIASVMLAIDAMIRMRGTRWREYVRYCAQPEQLPRPKVDGIDRPRLPA